MNDARSADFAIFEHYGSIPATLQPPPARTLLLPTYLTAPAHSRATTSWSRPALPLSVQQSLLILSVCHSLCVYLFSCFPDLYSFSTSYSRRPLKSSFLSFCFFHVFFLISHDHTSPWSGQIFFSGRCLGNSYVVEKNWGVGMDFYHFFRSEKN